MIGQRWSRDVVWPPMDYVTLGKDDWGIRADFYLELFMNNNPHENPMRWILSPPFSRLES